MVYKYIKLRVRSDNVFHTTIMKNSTEVPLKTSSVWRLPYDAVREGNGNPLQCSCLENPGDGGAWWAAIYGVTQSLGQEGPLEKEMATHSHIFAWRIPWTEEPDGIQSMGLKESDKT